MVQADPLSNNSYSIAAAGAGYGGNGGASFATDDQTSLHGGVGYGTATTPQAGSAGGRILSPTDDVVVAGGAGGGLIRVRAERRLWIDGVVSANGANAVALDKTVKVDNNTVVHSYSSGAGSGGGI